MDSQSLSSFEDKVRLATQLPAPPSEFVEGLWNRIAVQPSTSRPGTLQGRRRLSLHPGWIVTGLVLVALLAITLVIGPDRVFAAVRQLLGYIPGIGIVDENVPIRVLSEPVSLTRDGITITVTSGFLTDDRTHIEYRIFGVPRAAYPDREDVAGCGQSPYLLLPDGTHLESSGMADWHAVPQSVHAATLVLPCIAGTLPGTVPENWELHLAFVPAPPGLTVFPVVELSPSPEPTTEAAGIPTTPQDTGVTFDRVIETGNGYILIGRFHPSAAPGESVRVTDVHLRDASGRVIEYTSPPDIEPPNVDVEFGFGFVFEFNAGGLSYPLSLTISGVTIRQADPNAKTEFEFDAGPNPQPGQEWVLNQDLTLAGYSFTLVSIAAGSGRYSFDFRTGPDVFGASVDIAGYTPVGGGGGGGGGLTGGTFYATLGYADLPTGRLRVTVSNLSVIGDVLAWRGHWSPASPRTDWPPTPTPQPGACAMADTLHQPAPAPDDLVAGGLALTYEQIDPGTWGLVLHRLDGSEKEVLVPGGTWGTLSPDGDLMAYPSSDGIHVLDLETRAERVIEHGRGAYGLHWSPDGRQIAFVGETADGIHVIGLDGNSRRRVTDQAYASVIGWSPDAAQIYVAIPFTGGSAWKVRAIDAATSEWRDLFTIENGTPKFLSPALSPDGQWIAYRGTDNSSLYRVRLDGTDMQLVMTGVGQVVWSGSGWMGVTTLSSDQLGAVLVQAESCRAYMLPSLRGYLLALYVP